MKNIRSFENKIPEIAASAYVDPAAVVIGEVTIGRHSSIWPCAVVRGDIHSIQIGSNTSIQDGTILHVTHAGEHNPEGFAVQVGNNVTVGHSVVIHGCRIEDLVLVGIGSKILDGAMIETQVILGAGSLVPPGKVLTSGYLWLGSPVRRVRELTEKELAYLQYSANYYVKLKDRHLASLK